MQILEKQTQMHGHSNVYSRGLKMSAMSIITILDKVMFIEKSFIKL